MKDNRYLIRFGSRKIHPSRIRGRGFHGSHPRPSSSSSSSPLHGLMKRGMRAPGGERNCETGFEGTISEDCFAPFSASGNARIRLSSRGGGGGGGEADYFAGMLHRLLDWRNASLPVEQRFIRFEGEGRGGGGRRRVDVRAIRSLIRWLTNEWSGSKSLAWDKGLRISEMY